MNFFDEINNIKSPRKGCRYVFGVNGVCTVQVEDREQALSSLKTGPSFLQNYPAEYKDNRDFNLDALAQDVLIWEYINEDFKNDEQFKLDAIHRNAIIFALLDTNIQNNPEFVSKAIERNPNVADIIEKLKKIDNEKNDNLLKMIVSSSKEEFFNKLRTQTESRDRGLDELTTILNKYQRGAKMESILAQGVQVLESPFQFQPK